MFSSWAVAAGAENARTAAGVGVKSRVDANEANLPRWPTTRRPAVRRPANMILRPIRMNRNAKNK